MSEGVSFSGIAQAGNIRTADFLGAFSLASDLAVGHHPEHGARCCYIGMHIAREMDLSIEDRSDLFYAELLKDAGCTAYTSELATLWLTDELTAKYDLQYFRDANNPLDVMSWSMRYVAAGVPIPARATRVLDFLGHGRALMREGFESTCQMASRIAERLGMPRPVQDALMQIFEQWDGKGMPQGNRGEAIPLVSRIVFATSLLDIYHRAGGREAALRLTQERRGKAFDPTVADAFLSVAGREPFWAGLEHERLWDTVLSLEPEESSYRYFAADKLPEVALALADFADMKAPYLAGHSRTVADIAQRIARRMSLPLHETDSVYLAALLHDIGIVAVPTFVLDKPQARRTEAEREQVRLHPYHTERILSKVPALAALVPIAGAHHERMDGQGYHRGLPGAQIPPGGRILAVASRFDELSRTTPDSPPLATDDALALMRQEAGVGLSREAFQALVEEQQGVGKPAREKPMRRDWPAGLTAREVEVLRLIARGLSRRQAAKDLFVSEGTIRSHLEHIYAKTGVSNRASATLFAIEHDLLH